MEVVDFKKQVEEVLVKDLGHKLSEAQRLVKEAMLRNPNVSSPEELFEEVYRGQKEIVTLKSQIPNYKLANKVLQSSIIRVFLYPKGEMRFLTILNFVHWYVKSRPTPLC